MLSGYGLTASYHKNGLTSFWHKRITGVWVPYVLWELCAAIVLVLLKSENVASLTNTVLSILAIKPASVIDAQWYVTYIMIMYVAFWLAHKGNVSDIGCSVVVAVVGFALGVFSLLNIFPRYAGIWYYSFCFSAGILLYLWLDKDTPEEKQTKRLCSTGALSMVMYCATIITTGTVSYLYSMIFSVIFTVFVCYLMIIGKRSYLLEFLGKHSYYIFLCNTFLISMVRKAFISLEIEFDSLYRIALLPVIVAFGVALSCLYSFCKKRMIHKAVF